MIFHLNTPARRIAFAIAVSALIHAAIFWLPNIRLPHFKVELPPLTATIEHIEKPVEASSAKPMPDSPIAIGDNGTLPASAPLATVTMKKMHVSTDKQPFPKHLQLIFITYQGVNMRKVGEIHHQLDIESDHYTLQAETQTRSPFGTMQAKHIVQTSAGKFGEHGFQPDFFKAEIHSITRAKTLETRFDWINRTLHLANGEKTALPDDTQDMLSFMYQLSQIPFNGEFFPLPISDDEQLTTQQIEIGAIEELDTPMGELKVRHLRQMHERQTAYFEIWLALEYRMLPVKFRRVNETDETIDEFVIADIREGDKSR